jgi:nucleotide-binding universal stress UspA family protein
MFKRILLPVDLSERHQRAIDTAADLASQSGGEVVLLHIIEVIQGLSLEEEKDFYERLEKMARKHLGKLSGDLQARKISARTEILYGQRGPEIVRYASGTAADLIVLTAPRLDPANPALGWASLSYKIGFLSPCPVLLVK